MTTTSTLYLKEQLLEEVESHGQEQVHSREKRTFHGTLGHTDLLKGSGGVDGGHVQSCPLFKDDDFIFKKKMEYISKRLYDKKTL